MFEIMLAAVGTLGVVVAAYSRGMRPLPVTAPMLALLLGVVLGPQVLGIVLLSEPDAIRAVHTGTRLLLAVGLMAVALRYPLSDLRQQIRPVVLMLVLVMPAMAAAMSLAAAVTLTVPMAVALAIGAALSPTDPVLASGVVTGGPAETSVPQRLREVLSIESGVNDGLALPLVAAALAVAAGPGYLGGFLDGMLEVVVGTVAGAAMGTGAGWLMTRAEEHHDVEEGPRLLFTLVLALAALGVIELIHGNAILGVLVAGFAFSRVVTSGDRRVEASIDEGMNSFLVLPVFALLGAVLPWHGWGELGWVGATFVAAALVIRRLPWVLLLARPLRMSWRGALWLGWFGPIGVATLFYVGHLHERGMTDPVIWHAGTLAVAVSTMVHGATPVLGRRLVEDEETAGVEGRTTGPGWPRASSRP